MNVNLKKTSSGSPDLDKKLRSVKSLEEAYEVSQYHEEN